MMNYANLCAFLPRTPWRNSDAHTRVMLTPFAGVVIALSLFLGAGLASCNGLSGPPSDARLRSTFMHHEGDFARLVSMCKQDRRVVRIASQFTWLAKNASWPRRDVGLTQARWNQYRSLFQRLGIRDGVSRRSDYPGAIFFIAYASGLVTDGSYKGFVYSTGELKPLAGSLDNGSWSRLDPKKEHVIRFKRLEAHWYLFRERY